MARKKNTHIEELTDVVTVQVTGPHCQYQDRTYQPGETATVPAELAKEWILTGRASVKDAEVRHDTG